LHYTEAIMHSPQMLIEIVRKKMHDALDVAMNGSSTHKVLPEHKYIIGIDVALPGAGDFSAPGNFVAAEDIIEVNPYDGIAEVIGNVPWKTPPQTPTITPESVAMLYDMVMNLTGDMGIINKEALIDNYFPQSASVFKEMAKAAVAQGVDSYHASELEPMWGAMALESHPGAPTTVAKGAVCLDDLTPALAEFMADYVDKA
jgi:hypothetical protein